MEMARTYLMRVKHAIANVLGWEAIAYCDTDSIMISFNHCEPLLCMQIDELA